MRCRHRRSWFIGLDLEWCYACGAIRRLNFGSPWCKPVGVKGKNPYCKWDARTKTYLKKKQASDLDYPKNKHGGER